jgi:hypothetical protein
MLTKFGETLTQTYGLFADDWIINRKILGISDIGKLQTHLNRLGEWAVENEMKINPDKSKAVRFTRARVRGRLTYYFGDQLIPEANSFKYLGIIIRSHMLGRSCKLYAMKSMEGPSFNNAYTQTGK